MDKLLTPDDVKKNIVVTKIPKGKKNVFIQLTIIGSAGSDLDMYVRTDPLPENDDRVFQ